MRPSIVVLKDRLAPYLLKCRECQWSKDLVPVPLSVKSAIHKVQGGSMVNGDASPNHERSSTVCRICWTQFGWYLSPGLLQTPTRPLLLCSRLNLDSSVKKT